MCLMLLIRWSLLRLVLLVAIAVLTLSKFVLADTDRLLATQRLPRPPFTTGYYHHRPLLLQHSADSIPDGDSSSLNLRKKKCKTPALTSRRGHRCKPGRGSSNTSTLSSSSPAGYISLIPPPPAANGTVRSVSQLPVISLMIISIPPF